MFIGAKNSGKSYGLVKLLKFYEDEPIKDSDDNTLQIRTILLCPTANSVANPIFQSLKSLQEEDVILNYSDDILLDKIHHKIEEISIEKQEIADYKKYIKAWKKFEKLEEIEKLDDEEVLLLSKWVFTIQKCYQNHVINSHQ